MSEGWNVLDEEARVLWREYAFTKGAYATTLVFRGEDGLVVVSPDSSMEARQFDALREHGEVRALVANNTMHHLGLRSWKARFPDAGVYTPGGAIPTMEKKYRDLPFRPLSDLKLPKTVHASVPAGMKTGESFFSIQTKKGAIWFAGDMLANISRLPPPPVRWLFTASGSAPGFRLFKLAVWLMVSDRKALRTSMLDRLAKDPPGVVVPGHGPPFDAGDVAALVEAQLGRL